MKKYVRAAQKMIQHGDPYRRPGPNAERPWKEYIDYTNIKELYQMLKDAGIDKLTSRSADGQILYTADINMVSGPATVTAYSKPNDTTTYDLPVRIPGSQLCESLTCIELPRLAGRADDDALRRHRKLVAL